MGTGALDCAGAAATAHAAARPMASNGSTLSAPLARKVIPSAHVPAILDTGIHMIPLDNFKVVHLIRHAQGFHNLAWETTGSDLAYRDFAYEDAHLTPKGWRQCAALRNHMEQFPEVLDVDLVVVSPLTRTLETAAGVFGRVVEGTDDGGSLLMSATEAAPDKRETRPAIAAHDSPPVVACEWCRESLGTHPCDRRRTVSALQAAFPAVDFSQVTDEEDRMWDEYGVDQHEPVEKLQERALLFIEWLRNRPEKRIAVVSHNEFLKKGITALFNGHPHYCEELSATMSRHWVNCEMRSFLLTGVRPLKDEGHQRHPWEFQGGDNLL